MHVYCVYSMSWIHVCMYTAYIVQIHSYNTLYTHDT